MEKKSKEFKIVRNELENGDVVWMRNGKRHREDGPAYETVSGTKAWYLDGEVHREDGPAVEWSSGGLVWYLNDRELSKEDHEIRTAYLRTSLGKLILSGNYNKQLKK